MQIGGRLARVANCRASDQVTMMMMMMMMIMMTMMMTMTMTMTMMMTSHWPSDKWLTVCELLAVEIHSYYFTVHGVLAV